MHFLYTYEYGTLKLVKVILPKEREKRENNGGVEPSCSTLYINMEMSQ
jgi:hypothetical protein